MFGSFTADDAKNALELFKLISSKGKFDLTVAEALKMAKLMTWYNSLPQRLQEASVEIKQVVSTEEPVEAKKPTRKPRTKKD